MGALCSRFKVRVSTRRPKYETLRTESPSTNGVLLSSSPRPWSEAGERIDSRARQNGEAITTNGDDLARQEKELADSSFDRIANQIKELNKPIEMLRNAIKNSLLLFRMALGLTSQASIDECFKVLRDADSSLSIELVNTADGPHKINVSHATWVQLSDNIQAAIKHFNSLLSSCHKFIGSRELKLVDIQLKLDDLQLLPLTEERQQELDNLHKIPAQINNFTDEIHVLFESISEAGKLLEYQVIIDNGDDTF